MLKAIRAGSRHLEAIYSRPYITGSPTRSWQHQEKMKEDKDGRDDTDSGHPTPPHNMNEMITSTPLPNKQKRISRRSTSFLSEPPSPILPHHSSKSFDIVNGMIEVMKDRRRLEKDAEDLRNSSIINEHELEAKDAKILELTRDLEAVRQFTVTAEIDLRKVKQEDASVDCDIKEREMIEEYEKLEEELRRIQLEKDEMDKIMNQLYNEVEEEKRKNESLSEWKVKYEMIESEKNDIMKRASDMIELNEKKMKEDIDRLKEELIQKNELIYESEEIMNKKDEELIEVKLQLEDMEERLEELNEEKKEINNQLKEKEELERMKNELNMRVNELENILKEKSGESILIRDMERKIKELNDVNESINKELNSFVQKNQDFTKLREEELAESTKMKAKIHELNDDIKELNKSNEEWRRNEERLEKTMKELEETNEDMKRIQVKLNTIEKELEVKKKNEEKLGNELDIARKELELSRDKIMKTDRNDGEMNKYEDEKKRFEEEKEILKSEIDQKNKIIDQLNDRIIEYERKKSNELMEAVAQIEDVQLKYKKVIRQYNEFKVNAQSQYDSDLNEKIMHIERLNERIIELESYPGQIVSIDGNLSQGRSLFDLLPSPIKVLIESSEDESIIRSVNTCKSLIVRNELEEIDESIEDLPSSSSLPSHILFIINGIKPTNISSSSIKFFLSTLKYVIERAEIKDIEEDELDLLINRLGDELKRLDHDIVERLEDIEGMNGRIGSLEEERRSLRDEIDRADRSREQMSRDNGELRNGLLNTKKLLEEEKEESRRYEDLAHEFKDLLEEKMKEMEGYAEDYRILEKERDGLIKDNEERKRKVGHLEQLNRIAEYAREEEIERVAESSRRIVDLTEEVTMLIEKLKDEEMLSTRERKNKERCQRMCRDLKRSVEDMVKVNGKTKECIRDQEDIITHAVNKIVEYRRNNDMNGFKQLENQLILRKESISESIRKNNIEFEKLNSEANCIINEEKENE